MSKVYDSEFIQSVLDGLDFSDIRWGVPYKVDEDTVMYMYSGNAGYRVEVDEQTEEHGFYVNVIGEATVVGTGEFEDDLRYCIELALKDAQSFREG